MVTSPSCFHSLYLHSLVFLWISYLVLIVTITVVCLPVSVESEQHHIPGWNYSDSLSMRAQQRLYLDYRARPTANRAGMSEGEAEMVFLKP